MAFGSFDSKGTDTAMSEINMIPLIDVMLVLLVIFIITAPLLTHAIRINVPQVSTPAAEEQPRAVDLAVDAKGTLYWNDRPIDWPALEMHFAQQAALDPQPEIRIRADADTRYSVLADIMGAARRAGMKRLGFVTRPGEAHPAVLPDATSAVPAGRF